MLSVIGMIFYLLAFVSIIIQSLYNYNVSPPPNYYFFGILCFIGGLVCYFLDLILRNNRNKKMETLQCQFIYSLRKGDEETADKIKKEMFDYKN